MKEGESVFEIHYMRSVIYINRRTISHISKSGRLMGVFFVFQGLREEGFYQFNMRGVDNYRMFTTEERFEKDLRFFVKKMKKKKRKDSFLIKFNY